MTSTNVTWHRGEIGRKDREDRYKQKGVTLWFTGLSGSGKSTIASRVENLLLGESRYVYRLDGDNIRHGLCSDLGFGEKDRNENIRRVAEVSKLFTDAGSIVLTAFISPYRKDRDAARTLLAPGDFIEVFVNTPLEVCEARDPKGLYKRARKGEIRNFTGLDAPYEAPQNPEIEILTENEALEASTQRIVSYLRTHNYLVDES